MKNRRSFSTVQKRDIVEDLISGRKTMEELERLYEVSKYQILRWKEKYLTENIEKGKAPAIAPAHLPSSHITPRDQDQTIFQLKIKLADLMLENERLKAQLGNRSTHVEVDHLTQKTVGLNPIK